MSMKRRLERLEEQARPQRDDRTERLQAIMSLITPATLRRLGEIVRSVPDGTLTTTPEWAAAEKEATERVEALAGALKGLPGAMNDYLGEKHPQALENIRQRLDGHELTGAAVLADIDLRMACTQVLGHWDYAGGAR